MASLRNCSVHITQITCNNRPVPLEFLVCRSTGEVETFSDQSFQIFDSFKKTEYNISNYNTVQSFISMIYRFNDTP